MDQESSICLIQLYETYRFLWDAKDKAHHNKPKREDAWKEMSEKMQLPVAVLKAKMKTLIGSYRSERSRENKSRVTGSGSEDVYESKWFAYKYLYFLSDKDNPREPVNTETAEGQFGIKVIAEPTSPSVTSAATTFAATTTTTSAVTTATTSAVTTATTSAATTATTSAATEQHEPQRTTFRAPGTSSTQRTGIKRKKTEQDEDSKTMSEALKIIQSSVNSLNDAYFTYAMNLANELRKYDANTLAHVKRAFANILFHADIGMFSAPSSYSTAFQTPTPYTSPSESSTTSNECMIESCLLTSNTCPTSSDASKHKIPANTIESMFLNF